MKKLIFLLLVVSAIFADEWIVPDSLVGKWIACSEIRHVNFRKGDYTEHLAVDSFDIEIEIMPNGDVIGKIGDAEFVDCKFKRNRGWLGRLLNIKTDFIIKDGYLSGKITPEDDEEKRLFTIPLSVREGRLKGGFMRLHKWKYPDPMLPRLYFERVTN